MIKKRLLSIVAIGLSFLATVLAVAAAPDLQPATIQSLQFAADPPGVAQMGQIDHASTSASAAVAAVRSEYRVPVSTVRMAAPIARQWQPLEQLQSAMRHVIDPVPPRGFPRHV